MLLICFNIAGTQSPTVTSLVTSSLYWTKTISPVHITTGSDQPRIASPTASSDSTIYSLAYLLLFCKLHL